MLIAGFDRVYEIGPSFRAEKSHTVRHIAEFTHLDVELAFIENEDDVYKIQEKLMEYVLKYVKNNCKKELDFLEVKIEIPELPFPRVTHGEAVKMLQQSGESVKEGKDIGIKEEKKLGELVKKKYKSDFYFLTNFPWNLEVCKFYWMRNGDVGRGADLEYRGQELTTGSQREHRHEKIVEQIKEKGLDPKDFEYYLHPFKYGAPPHGGFGLGIDRLVMYILGLKNVREAVLFPRDTERLTP
jgi:aspartyl-tRNA synthetase